MKAFTRKLHRWLGLLVSLQIIAWMASGLYFAWVPIGEIRGEHLTREPPRADAARLAGLVSPEQAWKAVSGALDGPAELADISLRARGEALFYRVSGRAGSAPFTRLVHGLTGEVAAPLGGEEAAAAARALLKDPVEPEAVIWIEELASGHEIRGRPVPLWEVRFSQPERLSLYLDPWTGELLGRRTTRWRVFDFLWMLHIMDFDERDDFNTPLLQVAAALGLLVALSGVIFWFMTSRLFRRRRVSPG